MRRILCCLLAVALGGLAFAEEKKVAPKLSGTWVREHDGTELKFKFEEKSFEITVSTGDNGMTATAEYTVDAEGVVKAKVTSAEEKGNFPAKPAKGFEFSFKIEMKDKKATISDFKSEHEGAKGVVEGEYEKK